MTDLLDSKMDNLIRAALLNADLVGNLSIIADVVGIAGGVAELRKIMESTDELSLMDRGTLGIHLLGE